MENKIINNLTNRNGGAKGEQLGDWLRSGVGLWFPEQLNSGVETPLSGFSSCPCLSIFTHYVGFIARPPTWLWLLQGDSLLGSSPGLEVFLLTCSSKNPKMSLTEPNWLGLSRPPQAKSLWPKDQIPWVAKSPQLIPPLQLGIELILPEAQSWGRSPE